MAWREKKTCPFSRGSLGTRGVLRIGFVGVIVGTLASSCGPAGHPSDAALAKLLDAERETFGQLVAAVQSDDFLLWVSANDFRRLPSADQETSLSAERQRWYRQQLTKVGVTVAGRLREDDDCISFQVSSVGMLNGSTASLLYSSASAEHIDGICERSYTGFPVCEVSQIEDRWYSLVVGMTEPR